MTPAGNAEAPLAVEPGTICAGPSLACVTGVYKSTPGPSELRAGVCTPSRGQPDHPPFDLPRRLPTVGRGRPVLHAHGEGLLQIATRFELRALAR